MNTKKQIDDIIIRLQKASTPEGIAAFKKFIPGEVTPIGVRMPVINQLAKELNTQLKSDKEDALALAEQLCLTTYPETQILAAKILEKAGKKNPALTLKIVEQFSGSINNWAVCDAFGMQACKGIVKTHFDEITKLSGRLIVSENLWQRRLAIVLMEYYTREKEKHPAIKELLLKVKGDKEYYVKKAVVWIERNFEKGK
ncbi:MAG: DNA alkylation repair protein [Bacteroidetes bacterium]|nr:DNA alkylation repair protein [Bacteroidota bacterium]